MINAVEANFLISATGIKDSPEFNISEVVFLGRSNVGKSSFINAIANKKGLAKSSQTPGKTQLINFFDIKFKDENNETIPLIFVDLPGFGYAKVSKKTQHIWQKKLDEFLKARTSIRLFIHLIDSRQYNLEIDENLENYLNSFLRKDQKILKFYTKSDKLNQSAKSQVLKYDKDANFVSTLKMTGIDKARELVLKGVFGL